MDRESNQLTVPLEESGEAETVRERQSDSHPLRSCPRRWAIARIPRIVIMLITALFSLFVLGMQFLFAAVIWFLGVLVPLQPWSSLFLDGLVVLVGFGGALVLMQP